MSGSDAEWATDRLRLGKSCAFRRANVTILSILCLPSAAGRLSFDTAEISYDIPSLPPKNEKRQHINRWFGKERI